MNLFFKLSETFLSYFLKIFTQKKSLVISCNKFAKLNQFIIIKKYRLMTEAQMNTLVAGYVLNQLGFQAAPNSNIPQLLKLITPCGGTAMRDSVMSGCSILIKLYQFLSKMGAAEHWNFVQVVLTDGLDQNSKSSLADTVKGIYAIGQLLNVKMLKIILIGVGVSAKAQLELKTIAQAGGENAEYYSVDNADISRIFQRITISLGLQERQEIIGIQARQTTAIMYQKKYQPVIQVQKQNFAVLLNLDVSGSMEGQKWSNVCNSVDSFIEHLGEDDLISAMVFNDEVKMLGKISTQDRLVAKQTQKQTIGSVKKVEVNPEECNIY